MFKKTMKFDDLEGNEVTQTFYFNYNKKEIAELLEFGAIQEFADPNREYLPLEKQLEKLQTPTEVSGLTNTENNRMAYGIFQDLILDAYGVKGDDNVSFDKTPALRHYFSTHVAFPELVFEFLGNTALASEFIENCLPPRLVNAAKEDMASKGQTSVGDRSLSQMVSEANERQQDPETRVEPGPQPALVKPEPLDYKALSVEDIENMDDESFQELDPKKLSKVQMMAAFQRKSKG